MATTTTKFEPNPATGRTFANQSKLPKLPIPPLEDTCRRYLRALEGLQTPKEHEITKLAVGDFVRNEGPRIQEELKKWAENKDSYIEDFWYESYLSHTDPVVLALNPFFVLEDDPTPSRGTQLPRAAALVTSSLGFIHDLREGMLEPDSVRGIPLDMDQYTRLFGTARIPTQRGCKMHVNPESRHVVILRRGQFYWFDVLDSENRPLLTEREILRNLQAIVTDADKLPKHAVSRGAVGVLTTEQRITWSSLRATLKGDGHGVNTKCLNVVDNALFIVCLDDDGDEKEDGSSSGVGVGRASGTKAERAGKEKSVGWKGVSSDLGLLCSNFLCGTYEIKGGVQVGTCTNRWYDKLQIIVTSDGSAGINFEHTGVDGHTVLRFAADIFTDGLMLLARSINPTAPTLFHAPLSPYAKSYKPPKGTSKSKPQPNGNGNGTSNGTSNGAANRTPSPSNRSPTRTPTFDTSPKKLEWTLVPELRAGIRFAETRLSDLICQNDCQALEFSTYGKIFITSHGFSPDAFVQMAFQAAYYGLYGMTDCTYEPAMTKAFLHGRTEAIRTVQPESVAFTKAFFSEQTPKIKIDALRKACDRHTKLTRECSQGLGQDRHLYAIYCLLQREISDGKLDVSTDDPVPDPPNYLAGEGDGYAEEKEKAGGGELPRRKAKMLPAIFTDPGWGLLGTSILSTSNCGNPALRLFGFGPVAADGYGIGYIVKDDGISVVASSKHLQTRRFLDTLERYLLDVQKVIIQLHREANERSAPFVDHMGILRDARTGRPVNGLTGDEIDSDVESQLEEDIMTGYSFFDSGDIARLGREQARAASINHLVGKIIPMAEY